MGLSHNRFRRTGLLSLLLFSILMTGSSLFAEAEIMQFVGKKRSDVVKMWGPPTTIAYTDNREILTYYQGRIFLENGIVTEVGALLKSSAVPPPSPRHRIEPVPSLKPLATPPKQPVASPVYRIQPSSAQYSQNNTAPVSMPATAYSVRSSASSQPSPYDEPPSLIDLVVKPLLKAAFTFLVLAGALVGLVVSMGKAGSRRRRDRFNPADLFSSPAHKSPRPDGVFPARHAPPAPAPVRNQLDAKLLSELDWLLFEDLTAEYFRQEGYRADLSRMGADGGVDIYLHRSGEPRPFAYVQCKAWGGARQIGVEPMRALYGVMAAAGIKTGYFVCIGEFSADARAFAQANNIQMITGELFIARFNCFPHPERARILTRITQGDYTTPSCAKCGTKMVPKDFAGRDHWCCPRFPKCRSKPIAVRTK